MRTPMMAITTSNSINVNPRRLRLTMGDMWVPFQSSGQAESRLWACSTDHFAGSNISLENGICDILPQCGKLHPDEIGELTVKRQTIGNMLCASYYSVSR